MWKSEIREGVEERIRYLTSHFEDVVAETYRELMEIKNRVHLAFGEVQ